MVVYIYKCFVLLLVAPGHQHLQMTVQALQDELRIQRDLNQLLQQDLAVHGRDLAPGAEPTEENYHRLHAEHERQAKELFLLRKTLEEMELRIDTQKQTMGARDESIKKLLEMLQSKGELLGSHGRRTIVWFFTTLILNVPLTLSCVSIGTWIHMIPSKYVVDLCIWISKYYFVLCAWLCNLLFASLLLLFVMLTGWWSGITTWYNHLSTSLAN